MPVDNVQAHYPLADNILATQRLKKIQVHDARLNDIEVDNVYLLSRIAHAMEGGRIPGPKDTHKTMQLSMLQNQRKRLVQLESDLKRLENIQRNNNALQSRIDDIRQNGGRVDCWNLPGEPPAESREGIGTTLSCRAHRDVTREEKEFAKLLLQSRSRARRNQLAMEWLGYAERLGPISNYPPRWWRTYRIMSRDTSFFPE